jgi:lipid-binding SYLF domain-containing protein
MRLIRSSLVVAVLAGVALLTACDTFNGFDTEPEQLVDKSRISVQSMMADSQYPALINLASRAKAIIIVPNLIRAAFFFGGRGGNGVMLVRHDDGTWSQPAFYTIGGISWGLQFGGQSSELIVAVMTDKGLKAIMDREVTLGADSGIAVLEWGAGANASTGMDMKADMYAFARSEGLFVGVSLEGSVIAPRETWDQELYGQDATPESVLVTGTSHSDSQAVKNLVAAMP